jgi:AcrR family transcriptional regulator
VSEATATRARTATTAGQTTRSTRAPRPTSRERLLEAAAELFYAEGTVAVGVDKVCQQAQVSKRSLYQLFGTKDELVAESLRQSGESLLAQYLPLPDDVRPARERILHVFGWLDQTSSTAVFAGCPFVNTAIELKNPAHPAAIVAAEFKDELTAFFEREAASMGVADPALLAQQLTIVFDGCGARVVVTGQALDGLAAITATTLIDAAS